MKHLQQDSRQKQTRQKKESGILGDSAVNTSSFWCDGKKDLSILMQGIGTD